jgi:hypothetical protein
MLLTVVPGDTVMPDSGYSKYRTHNTAVFFDGILWAEACQV